MYLPTVLFNTGQGAIAPAIVLSATQLGASAASASLVVAMAGVGLLLGDVPAGVLSDRLGERTAMMLATAVSGLAMAICLVAGSVWLLGAGVVLAGIAAAQAAVARQVYVTEAVPLDRRARALSTLGGIRRVGSFVGPLLAAPAIVVLGLEGAYWVGIAAAALTAAALTAFPDARVRVHAQKAAATRVSTAQVVRSHAGILRTLGVGIVLIGAVRACRQAVIPLWGTSIDLDAATITLIYGLSAAVDMALFYPSGMLMDARGRRWSALPALAMFAVGFLLLPFARSAVGLALVASLLGVANGMSTGIVMTLGADVSPIVGRPQFLGVWRLCTDVGGGAGPVMISGVVAVASLGVASVAVGATSALAALALHRWIPREVPSR